MSNLCRVASLSVGPGQPLAIIAGPCVLESLELGLTVGRTMRDAAHALGLSYIFKGSFDKANRSSISSARGPGLEQGTAWLAQISRELGVPCTTDIHEPHQAEPVARVVDLIQIPAFLCRQTDLLLAAGQAATKHNRAVNIKKGQFISPAEMRGATKKLAEAGCTNVMLTERGTFFGYGRLVNDFIGLGDMMDLGHPVCFDCTHSTQLPGPSGGAGEQTGGRPERAPLLARAAVAAGVHCLFIETHTEPKKSLSDAYTTLTLDVARGVIREAAAIRGALGG
ncbi:MAG: 3-deoxy-8-phosphooctulonate synthase [Phycisphaerales bacterium]|nr:3-deoxy-8-phosphooctulonate synthase [Phycisphaerales bacterium]